MRPATFTPAVGAVLTVAVSAVLLPATTASASGQNRTVDSATAASIARIADTLLTERTTALLDSGRAHRAPVTGGHIRLSAAFARAEDTALSSLRTRKTRLAALGEAYTAADTQVSVDTTEVKGARATVQVTETTTLTYKKIRGDEPTTTGFKARHELVLTAKPGGTWELTAVKLKDDGPRPVNAPVAKAVTNKVAGLPSATPAATSFTMRLAPKSRTTSGYNYAAMAAYAEKYWRNYNPSYRSFNSQGGDCTNFISQALKAGGWKNLPGGAEDYRSWFYDSSTQSTSWVGANEWSWSALNSRRVTSLPNVFQMDVGDILQMDFDDDGSKDHSMITTYRSRAGVPYVTYHSTNTYRKSVASIVASNPDAVYYAYRT
ncbi:amidase domain-containing protein [Streptomyces sp. ISL-11]|uniref:amidase domain-containing protein n=1 Tax=Streptomyces sp. ISL-11 TaxID=2819174 RepID=UPI001BEAFFE8|nr:amidase domain-containing protein [Streptomyces sp. ISL-11]MBT2386507.1 amidase domain-containing protein [Streptomyces sp. ISL-11]